MDTSSQNNGLIFNIQRFSVHDGPGIRTTVFLKGCPMRCLWCSNPESQSFIPELMVRDINCKGCGKCIEACPQKAIHISNKSGRKIDWRKCNQCLICVNSCLYDSLKVCGTYMSVEEVVTEVSQDHLFYKNSNGGVTLSGGEPLSQRAFAVSLLRACRDAGLHTVLETSGTAPWSVMEEVLPFVDLTFYDIKHLDSERHMKATGITNDIVLKNLKKTSALTELCLRVPLIAGFNDSEKHIQRIAMLGRETGAKKISLLPYHEGGKAKCVQMGKTYPFDSGRPPGKIRIEKLKRLIQEAGIRVSVGS